MKTLSILAISMALVTLASCVVNKNGNARVAGAHDNGKHKGWYKNPNNPHNPAHNGTVVLTTSGTAAKTAPPAKTANGAVKGKKKK